MKTILEMINDAKYLKKSNGRFWLTDKNKKVPAVCPQCGAKMTIQLHGEPVFICKNGHYYGTLKCNLK